MSNIKQFVVSVCFVFGFTAYALNQKVIDTKNSFVREDDNSALVTPEVTQVTTPDKQTAVVVTNPVVKTTPKTPTQTKTQTQTQTSKPTLTKLDLVLVPVPTTTNPPAETVPQGKYRNGTYIGNVADATYGLVQVQAVISGGKISDVVFLSYPNDRPESLRKSQRAMPILKQEAISAQDSNVDAVSGASYTSAAFVESLGNALAQAKV